MSSYNGWKNRETWNVALWLDNDQVLYNKVIRWKAKYQGKSRLLYRNFIQWAGLDEEHTPDGVAYLSHVLSYKELNEAIRDF